MRVSIRHQHRLTGPHGARARAVREAAWDKVCGLTFEFVDWLPGIDLTAASLPKIADEEEFFNSLGAVTAEILEAQEFEAALSGDEMLAWLEESFNGGKH